MMDGHTHGVMIWWGKKKKRGWAEGVLDDGVHSLEAVLCAFCCCLSSLRERRALIARPHVCVCLWRAGLSSYAAVVRGYQDHTPADAAGMVSLSPPTNTALRLTDDSEFPPVSQKCEWGALCCSLCAKVRFMVAPSSVLSSEGDLK